MMEVSTAFFNYDLDHLRNGMTALKTGHAGPLVFRVRLNPLPRLLAELNLWVDFFQVSSRGECEILRQLGISDAKVMDSLPAACSRNNSHEQVSKIVSECGTYTARVLAVKLADWGEDVVLVHGGLQHLGRPYLFAREREFRVWRAGRRVEAEVREFLIAGSLCLSHDVLHPRALLPEGIRRGDWIEFPNSGILGVTAGTPFFIGQDLPREFVVSGGFKEEVKHKNLLQYHLGFTNGPRSEHD